MKIGTATISYKDLKSVTAYLQMCANRLIASEDKDLIQSFINDLAVFEDDIDDLIESIPGALDEYNLMIAKRRALEEQMAAQREEQRRIAQVMSERFGINDYVELDNVNPEDLLGGDDDANNDWDDDDGFTDQRLDYGDDDVDLSGNGAADITGDYLDDVLPPDQQQAVSEKFLGEEMITPKIDQYPSNFKMPDIDSMLSDDDDDEFADAAGEFADVSGGNSESGYADDDDFGDYQQSSYDNGGNGYSDGGYGASGYGNDDYSDNAPMDSEFADADDGYGSSVFADFDDDTAGTLGGYDDYQDDGDDLLKGFGAPFDDADDDYGDYAPQGSSSSGNQQGSFVDDRNGDYAGTNDSDDFDLFDDDDDLGILINSNGMTL